MSLPGSGQISMAQINAVFGRGNDLNAYRGTSHDSGSFPSGQIAFSDFWGRSAVAALSVSYPASASGTFFGFDYCGAADTQVGAPSISGGTGSYSYSWTRISGIWFGINSTTVQRPVWSIWSLCNDSLTEVWRVTVTSGNQSVTRDVQINLSYFTY